MPGSDQGAQDVGAYVDVHRVFHQDVETLPRITGYRDGSKAV